MPSNKNQYDKTTESLALILFLATVADRRDRLNALIWSGASIREQKKVAGKWYVVKHSTADANAMGRIEASQGLRRIIKAIHAARLPSARPW